MSFERALIALPSGTMATANLWGRLSTNFASISGQATEYMQHLNPTRSFFFGVAIRALRDEISNGRGDT